MIIIKYFFLVTILLSMPIINIAQNTVPIQKIRINPSSAVGGAVSRYIKRVNFIPLESTKESIINYIFQIEATEKYYVIYDYDQSSIFIFTNEGKFNAKIKIDTALNNGNPPDKFYIDKSANLIEIRINKNNYFYDMHAKLIKKIDNEKLIDSLVVLKINLGDKYVAYYNSNYKVPGDSVKYELLIYNEGELSKKMRPFNTNYVLSDLDKDGFQNFSPNFEKNDTTVYYWHSYDYNIYQLTPHTIKPLYEFIFPLQNSLPKDFITNRYYNNKRDKYSKENPSIVTRLYHFYKQNSLLFFLVNKERYIYDLKSQQLVGNKKITADSTSYFLSITQSSTNGFSGMDWQTYDGENFYSFVPAYLLFNQMEATKDKTPIYPQLLKEYFSDKKNKQGNPVLVQIQFKPSF